MNALLVWGCVAVLASVSFLAVGSAVTALADQAEDDKRRYTDDR